MFVIGTGMVLNWEVDTKGGIPVAHGVNVILSDEIEKNIMNGVYILHDRKEVVAESPNPPQYFGRLRSYIRSLL